MGFTLCPTDETVESLDVNFWNWRPTAELIGSFGLIDDERLERVLPVLDGLRAELAHLQLAAACW